LIRYISVLAASIDVKLPIDSIPRTVVLVVEFSIGES
jgi:hypothetical protein